MLVRSILLAIALAGCRIGDGLEDYYSGPAPQIEGLDVTSVEGNVGGDRVTITGANFGNDPGAVTVVFGSQNARIRDLTETQITVEVPRGPIEGGAVDVRVATPGGEAVLRDGFVYDLDSPFGTEGFYDGEIAYLDLTNDYFSCLAGIGHPSGDCSGWALSGTTGLDGRFEYLEFEFPRAHAPYVGYRNGFGGITDVSWERWAFETPAQDLNTFDLEDLVQDLRNEVQDFTVRNLDADEYYARTGFDPTWCVDERALAEFHELGYSDRLTREATAGDSCDPEYGMAYDTREVRFCQVEDYELARSYTYEPEWPVGEYFFRGQDSRGRLSDEEAARLGLTVPELGVDTSITVPPFTYFFGTEGFAYDAWGGYFKDVYSEEELQTLSLLFGIGTSCPDSDGNGETDPDDVVAAWEWEPVDWDAVLADKPMGEDVVDFRSFVRVTISYFQDGWLGLSGNPARLTITVPDDYNYDRRTGRARVELTARDFYRFPSAFQDKGSWFLWAGLGGGLGSATGWYNAGWGDPERSDYGMIFASIERVTEYKIATGRDGYLVVGYSTGDFGYTAYATHRTTVTDDEGHPYYDTSFQNPVVDGDSCTDCRDDDGDGWTDWEDPDCLAGTDEQGTSSYTCNDGLDNDGDGFVDAEDSDCGTGTDAETNCLDGEDNDEDGWTDADDPDCATGFGEEAGTGTDSCNDGVDDDGDGWVDAEDPDCTTGTDVEQGFGATDCNDGLDGDGDGWIDAEDPDCDAPDAEEVGFAGNACNNGIDDDGHGDIDADDPFCRFKGATNNYEAPVLVAASCENGVDDDGDGYVDMNDPDCEHPDLDGEVLTSWTSADAPLVPTCYDAADNDADGATDAQDDACVDSTGQPDGFAAEQ